MQIRKLSQAEHLLTRPLYEKVFCEDSKSFVDYYYTEVAKENEIYVLEENGDIRAMLHLNPYQISVNGLLKRAYYIVAVATQEEYRHRGYMAALLKKVMEELLKEGHSFTYLMAASEAIYEPFDFVTVLRREVGGYWSAEELPDGICCREAKEEDLSLLTERVNQALALHYQLYPLRSEKWLSRLRRELKSEDGKLMLLFKDGYLGNCLSWYPDGEAQKAPFMMRILDARKMLMSLRLKELAAMCFEICDPIIRENNRCVVLTGTEFSGVTLMDAPSENAEGKLSIRALTELIFGIKKPAELLEEEGVSMTERLLLELEKIEPISKIYFNEMV